MTSTPPAESTALTAFKAASMRVASLGFDKSISSVVPVNVRVSLPVVIACPCLPIITS